LQERPLALVLLLVRKEAQSSAAPYDVLFLDRDAELIDFAGDATRRHRFA
jgi:hypothetical protein